MNCAALDSECRTSPHRRSRQGTHASFMKLPTARFREPSELRPYSSGHVFGMTCGRCLHISSRFDASLARDMPGISASISVAGPQDGCQLVFPGCSDGLQKPHSYATPGCVRLCRCGRYRAILVGLLKRGIVRGGDYIILRTLALRRWPRPRAVSVPDDCTTVLWREHALQSLDTGEGRVAFSCEAGDYLVFLHGSLSCTGSQLPRGHPTTLKIGGRGLLCQVNIPKLHICIRTSCAIFWSAEPIAGAGLRIFAGTSSILTCHLRYSRPRPRRHTVGPADE